MELQHFSHEHPLILSEEKNDDGHGFITCKGCCQKISGFSYSCRDCSFFLHKFCAKLPQEMEHPWHPQHMLTLLPKPPYNYLEFKCDACDKESEAFNYHCSLCNFYLDTSCAVRAQCIDHESHKHPLSPIFSTALFECHACGTEHGVGVSYMCNTCRFWIHEDCASLPTTFKSSCHVHDLILLYSLPMKWWYSKCCSVCKERIIRDVWVYHCKGCDFDYHVNCSTNTKLTFRNREITFNDDLDETNSIHLPVPEESLDTLIDQFVKQISLRGDSKGEVEEELDHFSHEHPLTLFDALSDNNLCSGSELSILNENEFDKICRACVRPIPISIQFYGCSLCDFFIHKWCAKLPNKLQRACHPHPLILLRKRNEDHIGSYCTSCLADCNEFSFQCVECKIYVEVKCASLPNSIVHEAHEHPLFLMGDSLSEGCVACDRWSSMFSFGCRTCNFNLHYRCALLPGTIRHRYDKHPFVLTYSPIKDGPDEYICEFCEKYIDPNWWFYHCIDCDQSACIRCIYVEDNY